jgi:hypothetical protein
MYQNCYVPDSQCRVYLVLTRFPTSSKRCVFTGLLERTEAMRTYRWTQGTEVKNNTNVTRQALFYLKIPVVCNEKRGVFKGGKRSQ